MYSDEELRNQFIRCALNECSKYEDGRCKALRKDSKGVAFCTQPIRFKKVIEVIRPPVKYLTKPEPPSSWRKRLVHSRMAFLTQADIDMLCEKYKITTTSTMIEVCIAYMLKKQPDPREVHEVWAQIQRERRQE
jgi:hypothetical protein